MPVCKHCNKNFSSNNRLNYHLNIRKNKCYEENIVITPKKIYSYQFECEFCSKVFKRKDYLKKHVDKYHQLELQLETKLETKLEAKVQAKVEAKVVEELNLINNTFIKHFSELKQSIENNPKSIINNNNTFNNINNGNINNGNGNIVQNPQIHVKAYSQDNDAYITDEFLDECVKNPYEGIVRLTKHVNYHDQHPENYNMYMNNKKEKEISFYDNEKWVKRDIKSALNYIFNTQCDRIGDYMDANPEKFAKDIGFVDNMLHIIMDVSTHDTKMKNDKHYRNMVNNLLKIIVDNSHKVKKAFKDKMIQKGNKTIDMVYDNKNFATCVPLYMEPTPIT